MGEFTPATVDIPDLDFVTAWTLDDEVLDLIEFIPLKYSTNYYKMRIKDYRTNKDEFSRLFEPFVSAIQTHGNPDYTPEANFVSYLRTFNDDETYVSSNLMRNQMNGILLYLKSLGFKEEDFSDTGAARTVIYELSKFCSLFPDVTMDYVPQFIIPFKYLPERLKEWSNRDSVILTQTIKSKIMAMGGVMVAKSPKQDNKRSEITWRIAISPGELIEEVKYSGCNIMDALIVVKDLRIVALPQIPKSELSSHHIKVCLLWCIENHHNLTVLKLIDGILNRLSECYREHFLPDYFDSECNLIDDIKRDRAQEISVRINEVKENIDDWLRECLKRKNILKISMKQKILAHGVFKVQLLKTCCHIMMKLGFITSFISFRIFNNHIYMKWSPNKDNQSLMAKMIYKDNDPEVRLKFAAMIKSVLYSIIYVLE